MSFQPIVQSLGDSALLLQFGEGIDVAVNRRVHAVAALLQASPFHGLIETVPAYRTLLVHYDPLILTEAEIRNWVLPKLDQPEDILLKKPRQLTVPIRYGGEYGPDLEYVADYHRLRVEDVIRIHSQKTYTVYMMGFTPGFPYMGALDDAIVTPRLETPRTHVPAGTVGIAGSQTGIYPIDSPGGWRLIGHTPLRLFDLQEEVPFLFSPGDEVRFIVEK